MLQPESGVLLYRVELQISMEDCLLEVLEFKFSFALEDVSIEKALWAIFVSSCHETIYCQSKPTVETYQSLQELTSNARRENSAAWNPYLRGKLPQWVESKIRGVVHIVYTWHFFGYAVAVFKVFTPKTFRRSDAHARIHQLCPMMPCLLFCFNRLWRPCWRCV